MRFYNSAVSWGQACYNITMSDTIISPKSPRIALLVAAGSKRNGDYHYSAAPSFDSRRQHAQQGQLPEDVPYIMYCAVVSGGPSVEQQGCLAQTLAWGRPSENPQGFGGMKGFGLEVEYHPCSYNHSGEARIVRVRGTFGGVPQEQIAAYVQELDPGFAGTTMLECDTPRSLGDMEN